MKEKLYAKVKFVHGAGFLTIEDTKKLSDDEMFEFINLVSVDASFKHYPNLNILVPNNFPSKIDQLLEQNGFYLHDETVIVYKELSEHIKVETAYTFKTLKNIPLSDFKTVWAESMRGSLNAPTMSIDEQMESVEVELGSGYEKSCIVAYENSKPIGVIMPHIEPGTLDEGRLFYFGIVPNERGKGKSLSLHQCALHMLKNNFKASYYIGSTSTNNLPMLKTFTNNGCKVLERNKVYKRMGNGFYVE